MYRPNDEHAVLDGQRSRWAIEREEFEVHYQPVIELSTGRVDGFEALGTRRHRREGWYAAEFVVLAEETGLIRPISAGHRRGPPAKERRERYPDRAPS